MLSPKVLRQTLKKHYSPKTVSQRAAEKLSDSPAHQFANTKLTTNIKLNQLHLKSAKIRLYKTKAYPISNKSII